MQHRTGSAFCRKYGLDRLVFAEPHDSMVEAIAREKALKAWKRDWKIRLIEQGNPEWEDLFDRILSPPAMPACAGMTLFGTLALVPFT